jgi:hypothetical protein
MNSRPFIFLLLFFPFLFFSCKKQKIYSSEASNDEISKFIVQEIDYTYFISKAKINYKDKLNDVKANINIRMKKDSIIWISVNATAGIEAMRCLITTDSIFVLDRLNNNYSVYDFNSLSKQLNMNLSFDIIESIILGNLITPKCSDDKLSRPDTSCYILKQKNGNTEISNHVKISTMKIEKVEVVQAPQNNTLVIKYLNFVILGNYSFPGRNEIALTYKEGTEYQTTTIDIDHNKSELSDKELNFPFNVPNKFNRK